jgi:hypothetical protein
VALATALLPARAQVAALAPVELATYQQAAVDGLPALHPGNHPFKLASTVQVEAYNKSPDNAVSRRTSTPAASYASAPWLAAPALPTWPTQSVLHTFQTVGDNAQAWATMSTDGVPYLYLTAYGQSVSEATASWTTALTIPAGNVSQQVVLRFVVPEASVNGNTEQDGPAKWRARLRAELLVNGYPAWSSEAVRLAVDPYLPYVNTHVYLLQTFGAHWGFPSNDEDGITTNDSVSGSNSPAGKRVVYLSLGRFAPGAVLDLAMILRGTALTVGPTDTSNGNRCGHDKSDPSVKRCSHAIVTVRGNAADGPKIYLVP